MVFNDYDLPYLCPMIEDETELDDRFVKATQTVWKHLIRDPQIYALVWGESRGRDAAETSAETEDEEEGV